MSEPIITIVDDDDAVRDSLALLLNFRGFRCRGFASGEDCLAAWSPDWRGCLMTARPTAGDRSSRNPG